MVEPFACLYVEKGEPYHVGSCILLEADETVIGRPAHDFVPDVSFPNSFVSRRHLMIKKEQDQTFLYDLGSKHGTEVGGVLIPPHTPYPLKVSDRISLAHGLVVLRFSNLVSDMTLELEAEEVNRLSELRPTFRVDMERRLCYVDDEAISMSEKEWRLFLLLYEHPNLLVTIEEFKRTVWPERANDFGGVPDVGHEELTSLVYRIRKKLQKGNFNIHTIRGCGYIYETQSDGTATALPGGRE